MKRRRDGAAAAQGTELKREPSVQANLPTVLEGKELASPCKGLPQAAIVTTTTTSTNTSVPIVPNATAATVASVAVTGGDASAALGEEVGGSTAMAATASTTPNHTTATGGLPSQLADAEDGEEDQNVAQSEEWGGT